MARSAAEAYVQQDPEGLIASLHEQSAASKSEARIDRAFNDGSAVTVTSFQGAAVEVTLRVAEEGEMTVERAAELAAGAT